MRAAIPFLVLALTGCAGPTPAAVAPAVARLAAPAQAANVRAVAPAPSVSVYATEDAIQAAAQEAPAGAQEPAPDASQIAALAAASPDHLVENAPPEPGVAASVRNATGISWLSWLPWPTPPAGDLGNFGKVEDTLFRGARPTDKGLEQLQAMGVKTIVNFENDAAAVAHEQAWCQAHGIAFHSIALSVVTPPKQANIDAFLAYANDPAARPLYFHCMQGRDRTGTAALCYRISHDHWNFNQAYAEMKSYHFHTYLLGLQHYIREYAEAHHAG